VLTPDQEKIHPEIEKALNQAIAAIRKLNETDASTKYNSTYIISLRAVIAQCHSDAVGVAMWILQQQTVTPTAWTTTQIHNNTNILS